MGAKIKDYYRELEIPYKSARAFLICGIVAKKEERTSFIITKNEGIIETIVPEAVNVGDTVYLFIDDNRTYIVNHKTYQKIYTVFEELEKFKKTKKKIDGAIKVKKPKYNKVINLTF